MLRTRVKLCGFRTEETVLAASQAGADALGFVFYSPSARCVELAQAQALVKKMGPWQTPVALFVNPDVALVQAVVERIPLAVLQFHGDESPAFCEGFSRPYIKAIHMKDGVDLSVESQRFESAQALLLDAWSQGYGGAGHTFDWSLLPKPGECLRPLVLSGGLDALNVGQAIDQYRPYGVDVSSGIEFERGVKSIPKIVEFCKAVQVADAAVFNCNEGNT